MHHTVRSFLSVVLPFQAQLKTGKGVEAPVEGLTMGETLTGASAPSPTLSSVDLRLKSGSQRSGPDVSLTAFSPTQPTPETASAAALAARLEAECSLLAMFQQAQASFGYDNAFGWWVMVRDWRLPIGLNRRAITLLVVLPSQYPHLPPRLLLVPRGLGGNGWTLDELLPPNQDLGRQDAAPPAPTNTWQHEWASCSVPLARWTEVDDLDRALSSLYMILTTAARLRPWRSSPSEQDQNHNGYFQHKEASLLEEQDTR